jgi:hypothetical protein
MMLLLAAGLLVAGPTARAADGAARPQSTVEAGADRVRVQPSAKEFAPPFRPDVSASAARTADTLYRQLIGPQLSTSRGFAREHPGFPQATTQTSNAGPGVPNRLGQIPPAGSAANPPPPDKQSILVFHRG